MNILRKISLFILEWLYPIRAVCMGCNSEIGFEKPWLCDDCREKLAHMWIGASLPPEGCHVDGAAFAYEYHGPAGNMVRNLKYRGVLRLADIMSADMVQALKGIDPVGADMIVPVPMHPRRIKKRGYNQAEVLSQRLSEHLKIPCICALRRVRNTRQQARLSDQARLKNLKNAFISDVSVNNKCILLVDDVCTTGGTAESCAEALRAAGAKNVFLLCFALAKHQSEDKNGKNHQR